VVHIVTTGIKAFERRKNINYKCVKIKCSGKYLNVNRA
jgi:hypothetical protein